MSAQITHRERHIHDTTWSVSCEGGVTLGALRELVERCANLPADTRLFGAEGMGPGRGRPVQTVFLATSVVTEPDPEVSDL